jgi:spore germination protein
MEKKMKRRSYVRVVSFVAALAAVLVTASICGNVRASKYERQITLSQQRALTELDGRLREIGTSLKGVYSSTPPMLSGMASELSRETLAAKSSLSVLPLENTNLENTYKFLSQVGDFTETLNRKVASGESISDEERENLRSLITFCGRGFKYTRRYVRRKLQLFTKKRRACLNG